MATDQTLKLYKSGMYGGKFMPMHLGHLYCLKRASELCETVYLILFYGGKQETDILKHDHRSFLSLDFRKKQIIIAASYFPNVIPKIIDVSECFNPDGSENWDKETPLVLNACRKFDAVFGSEPDYREYFTRAYPWADYIIVDSAREEVPISATEIRKMNDIKEIKKWLV